MKVSQAVIIAVLAIAATPATAQPVISAGLVAFQCKKVGSQDLADSAIAAGLCTFLLRGFVDGWHAGSNRGLRVAFIEDKKNLATTDGIKDLRFRLDLLRPTAHCLPPQATIGQIADVFVRYMAAHPERKEEPYIEPLTDAIESYYCPR